MDFKQEIINLLKAQLNLNNITLEIPPNPDLGDYSLACFKLSQELKKSPQAIAEEIKSKIKLPIFLDRIQVTGAYLNFFLNKSYLVNKIITTILKQGSNYGKKNSGKSILIEHTSINPTGPIHVGRIRNAIIGDTLVRLYKSQGYNVSTHFYVNDVGKQVAILAWAKSKKIEPSKELELQFLAYRTRPDFKTMFLYVPANMEAKKDENKVEIARLIQMCESGNKKSLAMLRKTASICLKGQISSLKRFNITYDSFDFESQFIENKAVGTITKELMQLQESIDLDGAKALDLSKYGFERRGGGTVYLRADNTSVYLTRDLAYHEWKFKHSKELITVLGEDHKVEFNELKKILELIGALKKGILLECVFLSFVNLKDGKLSTREGRIIPIDELLDLCKEKVKGVISRHNNLAKADIDSISERVAASAIRYYIIKIQALKSILFDIDEALSFEGETGPYLLYAHVRAVKILNKAKITTKPQLNRLNSVEEINLVKILDLYPDMLVSARESNSGHTIAKYAYNLAAAFNSFYENAPILSAKSEAETMARLYLVKAFDQVILNCFDILGMQEIEVM